MRIIRPKTNRIMIIVTKENNDFVARTMFRIIFNWSITIKTQILPCKTPEEVVAFTKKM
jgi:hypothetical protein